jgi:hypothetical protein
VQTAPSPHVQLAVELAEHMFGRAPSVEREVARVRLEAAAKAYPVGPICRECGAPAEYSHDTLCGPCAVERGDEQAEEDALTRADIRASQL